MNGRLITVAAIAGLAGFAGGVRFNAPPQSDGAAPARTPLAVPAPEQTPGELARQIRAQGKLLAEIAGKIDRLAASGAGKENRNDVEASAAFLRADPDAGRRADELVGAALGTGVWSAVDRDELRRLLPRIETARREVLMRELIAAMNSGRLHAQVAGPPF